MAKTIYGKPQKHPVREETENEETRQNAPSKGVKSPEAAFLPGEAETATSQITPENMARLQTIQQAENHRRMLEQEAENKEHDPTISQYGASMPDQPDQLHVIGKHEVEEAMSILKKYKECKVNLENRIIENEEFFKMQHWEQVYKNKSERKSTVDIKPQSAWLFNSIINKHADIMDNYPEPNVLPREQSDEPIAEALSNILPVILEQNEYEQVYSDCAYYKEKTGTSVQGIFWDNEKLNGLGDISVKKCDILNLFWESGITDIQDSENVFYVTVMSNDNLEGIYPELKGRLGNYPELQLEEYIYDDKVDKTDKSAVVDWYYKKKITGTDEYGIPQVKTYLHYCKFCNGEVLYASENDPKYADRGWYDHGLYPFVVDTMFPEEGMLCGFGWIDVMKDTQTYIDKLDKAVLDNAIANARGKMLVRNDLGIRPEDIADPEKTLIEVTGSLQEEAFRQIELTPVSPVYEQILLNKIQEIKDTSGNTASSQGQSSNVTSASGIASLQEAAGKISRDQNKTAYRAFKKVCEQIIELIRQFYTEPRCFRIMGDNGAFQYENFDNSGMQPQEQGAAFGEELGKRVPIFDVRVEVAKKSAYSRESQNQMALNFYSAGFFAPGNADTSLAALEMMEFDGKEKVIDQVRRNGTMFEQLMQMQQSMAKMAAIIDTITGSNMTEGIKGEMERSQAAGNGGTTKKGSSTGKTSNGSLTTQAAAASRNAAAPR